MTHNNLDRLVWARGDADNAVHRTATRTDAEATVYLAPLPGRKATTDDLSITITVDRQGWYTVTERFGDHSRTVAVDQLAFLDLAARLAERGPEVNFAQVAELLSASGITCEEEPAGGGAVYLVATAPGTGRIVRLGPGEALARPDVWGELDELTIFSYDGDGAEVTLGGPFTATDTAAEVAVAVEAALHSLAGA